MGEIEPYQYVELVDKAIKTQKRFLWIGAMIGFIIGVCVTILFYLFI